MWILDSTWTFFTYFCVITQYTICELSVCLALKDDSSQTQVVSVLGKIVKQTNISARLIPLSE